MSGFFSWGKSEETPRVDEHASNPGAGGVASAPGAGAVAAHTVTEASQNALRLSATGKRGRKPKDAGTGASDNAQVQAALHAEIARQLEQVHDPKAWGALLAAPGDVAVTITGRKYWEISRDERDTLGACGSAAARTMMITNPKSLAFLMLSASLFSVYMPRMIQEMRHQRKEKEKEANDQQAASS